MSDEPKTPYDRMYGAPDEATTPEVIPDPIDIGQATESAIEDQIPERVFGATSIVDGTPLVYDETNEMWVLAEDHDEAWTGETPLLELAEVEQEDSPATHVRSNLEDLKLRMRSTADIRSDVIGEVDHKQKLLVLDDTHPEWTFVETGEGERGYVRKKFLVDVTDE